MKNGKLPDQKWLNFKDATNVRKQKIREEIFLYYFPLAEEAAKQYVNFKLPRKADLTADDILSCAKIGLLKAIDTYDLSYKTDFKTHAYLRVRGEIVDELRRIQFCRRNIPKFRREVARIIKEFEEMHGRKPCISELREFNPYFDVDGLGLEKFTDEDLRGVMFSDAVTKDQYGNDVRFIEITEDRERKVVDRVRRIEIMGKLIKALPNGNERRIVVSYFFTGASIKQIGKDMGLRSAEVSEMLRAAIERLRRGDKVSQELIEVLRP